MYRLYPKITRPGAEQPLTPLRLARARACVYVTFLGRASLSPNMRLSVLVLLVASARGDACLKNLKECRLRRCNENKDTFLCISYACRHVFDLHCTCSSAPELGAFREAFLAARPECVRVQHVYRPPPPAPRATRIASVSPVTPTDDAVA